MDSNYARYKELSRMLYEELKDLRDENVLPRHERVYAEILLRYAELVFTRVNKLAVKKPNGGGFHEFDAEDARPQQESAQSVRASEKGRGH